MAGGSGGRTVASRVLGLIGAFDAGHRRLTLSELAARADLSLPTAHRLVAELVEWGALVRDEEGTYAVGRRLRFPTGAWLEIVVQGRPRRAAFPMRSNRPSV